MIATLRRSGLATSDEVGRARDIRPVYAAVVVTEGRGRKTRGVVRNSSRKPGADGLIEIVPKHGGRARARPATDYAGNPSREESPPLALRSVATSSSVA